jgi:hypothetical protein
MDSCWAGFQPCRDTLLENIGSHTDYAALYQRKWQH